MAFEGLLVEELAAGPAGKGLKIGVATLNLPASLNALNLPLIDALSAQLQAWEQDAHIVCVVLQGAGGKAFCAGGDVRSLFDAAKQSLAQHDGFAAGCVEFFTKEYQVDYQIHRYAKPLLCLGHGIVMGGGLGLMVGASHRVVTEKTKIAMPEITIGLFPDVGGTYFLPRMKGKVGLYVALTGTRMNGADSVFAGLADYLLASEQLPELLKELSALSWSPGPRAPNDAALTAFLKQQAATLPAAASPLKDHLAFIEEVCAGPDLPAFIAKMQAVAPGDEWVDAGKKTFLAGSPSSAALIFAQFAKGRGIELADAFRFELDLAVQCTKHPDFVEGVRALLIDKDQKPQWQPATFAALSSASLASYLAPVWAAAEHPLRNLSKK